MPKNLYSKIFLRKEILHQKNFTHEYFFTKMFLTHKKIRPKMFFLCQLQKKINSKNVLL